MRTLVLIALVAAACSNREPPPAPDPKPGAKLPTVRYYSLGRT